MTDKEYCDKLNELNEQFKYEELYELQKNYMKPIVEEFKRKMKETDSIYDRIAYDLIEYAYSSSTSGSALLYLNDYDIPSEEKEEIISDILHGAITKRIGQYTLDEEYYEDNETFIIDIMFAGNYVPMWDGYSDYNM